MVVCADMTTTAFDATLHDGKSEADTAGLAGACGIGSEKGIEHLWQ